LVDIFAQKIEQHARVRRQLQAMQTLTHRHTLPSSATSLAPSTAAPLPTQRRRRHPPHTLAATPLATTPPPSTPPANSFLFQRSDPFLTLSHSSTGFLQLFSVLICFEFGVIFQMFERVKNRKIEKKVRALRPPPCAPAAGGQLLIFGKRPQPYYATTPKLY
jgi:hypothetical protein